MSLSNEEVLENLTSQLVELENTIGKLSQQLDTAKTQYLKVSGAVDVLKQIVESKEEEEVEE